MTSVVRYADITNTTGLPFTQTTGLITFGKEGGSKFFKRTFAANPADIGTALGQTRDATGGGNATGCMLVTIQGAKIKEIGAFQLFRPTVVNGITINIPMFVAVAAGTTTFFSYGFIISADGTSVYVLDAGSTANVQIVAGDFIEFELIFGNY